MDPPAVFKVLALGFTLLLIPSWEWLSKISDRVPEPYLDEVFHVGQAQVYCAGEFGKWDPKITTPPGLYLLSYVVFRITGRCDVFVLRALNCSLALFLAQISFSILTRLYGLLKTTNASPTNFAYNKRDVTLFTSAVHTAVNICLFPPLFFFLGLYYTDVPSTLFVLLSYHHALKTQQKKAGKTASAVVTVLIGVAALFFRQTNIFWVAVFPAGLAVVQSLKKSAHPPPEGAKEDSIFDVLRISAMNMSVYDKPVRFASVDDYVKTTLSLGIAALRYPVAVIAAAAPYAILIFLFGSFVVWNGGVVLGDKSNHIATLHLPQMLYIWPYILFFSFPILAPSIISAVLSLVPATALPARLRSWSTPGQKDLLPRVTVLAAWTLVGALVVYFNTIIHPFTLADNRHYVFYVFRILRAYPLLKYLAAPLYVLGGWLVVQALGSPPRLAITPAAEEKKQSAESGGRKEVAVPKDVKKEDLVEEGCQVSFVLVWLATTTLNLTTAPLVEPRYFIVPWIMWRLHFPIGETDGAVQVKEKREEGSAGEGAKAPGHETWLWAETAWFLLVNLATGYMFLNWGFEWPQEPGNVQRFMW
ncbi:putative glucosyltransferase [Phyllosticta citribraziliensis]|uniref:Dol-P-Glc:Glc(2)Man(9)GlcNAc(2)-PP-Dol alpha-1,2-glucosyltransferase n=1 Tax=Phyllosticta citribraziliensis TaxID=989973 RepID=A0ABR1LAI7_9PEZI